MWPRRRLLTPCDRRILERAATLEKLLLQLVAALDELVPPSEERRELFSLRAQIACKGSSLVLYPPPIGRLALSRRSPYWLTEELFSEEARGALSGFQSPRIDSLVVQASELDREIRELYKVGYL